MKEEKLLRALGDIGDDLLCMAEHRRFANGWKKWASLAATLVLVVSLGLLALPYFPMGCGASAPDRNNSAVSSTETAPADSVDTSSKPEIDQGLDDAAESPEQEQNAAETKTTVVCGGTIYYLNETVVLPGQTPANLSEAVGTVTESSDETLVGCTVYATTEATWFTNNAVDGWAAPNQVYVWNGQDYVYGTTFNEKTVSRYTAADVHAMSDDQLVEIFVMPLEAQNGIIDCINGHMDSETMNRLFLASLTMNTGLTLADLWDHDGTLEVPPGDVQRRLERFLDDVSDYDPTQTSAYDPDTGMLIFSRDAVKSSAAGLTLDRSNLEDNVLRLWVNLPDGDQKYYEIRLDQDSWRYLQIVTVG